MDKNYILSVIREYAYEHLRDPAQQKRRDRMEQASYSRWAADEILRVVMESETASAISTVEEFARKTDDFSRRNRKTDVIFSVAHDVAEDVLDILNAMK